MWKGYIFDKDTILGELVTSYDEIRADAAAVEKALEVSEPDAICIQMPVPAQVRKIFLSKVQ